MIALALVALVSLGPPQKKASADVGTTTTFQFHPGWDDTSQPLNYQTSWVSVTQSTGTTDLKINVHLEGAAPKTSHEIDFDIFSTSVCNSFGQLTTFDTCRSIFRQNINATVTPFLLGTLTTGESGAGNLQFTIKGVPPGTYNVEFAVGATNCHFCNIIYQAPGPLFNGTAPITVVPATKS
jgi:hypothetical protein